MAIDATGAEQQELVVEKIDVNQAVRDIWMSECAAEVGGAMMQARKGDPPQVPDLPSGQPSRPTTAPARIEIPSVASAQTALENAIGGGASGAAQCRLALEAGIALLHHGSQSDPPAPNATNGAADALFTNMRNFLVRDQNSPGRDITQAILGLARLQQAGLISQEPGALGRVQQAGGRNGDLVGTALYCLYTSRQSVQSRLTELGRAQNPTAAQQTEMRHLRDIVSTMPEFMTRESLQNRVTELGRLASPTMAQQQELNHLRNMQGMVDRLPSVMIDGQRQLLVRAGNRDSLVQAVLRWTRNQ